MFPRELVEAVEYLNTLTITVSENHEDGRVNSIDDEDTIIDLLIEKYGDNVEKPPARCWWDLKLFGYPINIKSSKFGSAADNFSSKAAILYALTNLPESEVTCSSWKQFQKKLQHNSSQLTPRDYYIIVLNIFLFNKLVDSLLSSFVSILVNLFNNYFLEIGYYSSY